MRLSAAALRRLPIFETVGRQRCVSLKGREVLGAPSDDADRWQPLARWDDLLRASLGGQLLSYEGAEARALLEVRVAMRNVLE
eukprot:1851133-Prymnesium_polylepis.1